MSPLALAAECPGPLVPALQPIAPEVWLIPGAVADTGADNHGKVGNQLLAREGGQLWLIGAGPTPAFARALDCRLRERFGHGATDLVVPWPHGEQALGASGYGAARHWVHADVAATMEHQCPACADALRTALGPAADELGPNPIAIPDRRFSGDSGELGPWRWWRLWRMDGQPVTLWRLRASPLYFAPGLLWLGRAPDSRLADIERLRASSHELVSLGAADGTAARWIGEQGGPADATAPALQAAYWDALTNAVDAAFARGEMLDKPPPLDGVDPALLADPRHALNWQRAWRQAEDRFLQAPAAASSPASAPQ